MKPLRFSRQAWHQRLHQWFWREEMEFKSICPYFWMTLATLLLSAFLFPARAIGAPMFDRYSGRLVQRHLLGAAIILSGVILVVGVATLFFAIPTMTISIGFIGLVALNLGILGLILGVALKARPAPPRPSEPTPEPQPSVVWEYLKAVKAQVCPRIEWVE